MKHLAFFFISVFGLWFVLHLVIISIDGLHDDLGIADVGIVLGNKVESDGHPSKRLKSRLDKAIELFQNGYCKYLIVSGGIGKEGYDEAEVMKDYLVKRNIPGDKIFMDRAGNNTYLTACNSKLILARLRLDSVLLISQFYHLTRTRLAFTKAGFTKIYSAHASFFEIRDCYSLVREFFGYYKYLFLKPLKR